jgi:hypothetical protein
MSLVEPVMMVRDVFGALVIAVIYCALFMAVLWIAMALGDGPHGTLQRIVIVVLAILSFPLIAPFLYFDWLSPLAAQDFVGAMIRFAFLNGLIWGFIIVWVHRKLLKRLGRTRLL